MIPNETPQTIETQGKGVEVVGNFDFTDDTKARIMQSLSDKMYTRKELASVREYSNNANDAHIVAGKPTSEVLITLPTMEDFTFKVRDFGSGLTKQQIRDVYCVMGLSTKRNSAAENGVLGYGCKAGFAHADSFTVTSWVNGEKTVYNCVKGDSTKLHSVYELSRTPSDEPSGIEICIPVKQSSLWTFHQEAADYFKYWEVLPTINRLEDSHNARMMKFRNTPPTLQGEGWNVRPRSEGSAVGVAFMGGVPYRIDWNVLSKRMSLTAQKRCLFDLLQNNDVTLFFKMGEVQFVDSRESLEYTDFTIKALMDRIESIFAKIQESFQAKFADAKTVWEAKMIYNSLFGTGMLELEKGEDADTIERIKVLDGNLTSIELNFRGTFKWNDIVIDDAGFDGINRFDNDVTNFPGIQKHKHNPSIPVMVTYRKKKKRAKMNRCTSESANRIVASQQVAVIINDTGAKYGQSVAARYLILQDGSKIRTVHVLNFTSQAVRDAFYAEYHFDTVPVLILSEILPAAKTWNNANKVSRSYGGGGGGTRTLRYMDFDESVSVEEMEVPIREIEEGAYFVEIGEVTRGRRRRRWHSAEDPTVTVKLSNGWHRDADEVAEAIKVLVDELGLDVPRVYIVGKQTSEAKWFKEAVSCGDWTNVWSVIEEALPGITNVSSLVDAEAFNGSTVVEKAWADLLIPQIMDKNSIMLKLIATGSDKNYDAYLKLVNALKELHYWDKVKGETVGTIDFEKVTEDAHAMYPYINFSNLENDYYAKPEEAAKVAKYVNAMDLFIDLTRDMTPPTPPQPVVEEKVEEAEVAA